MVRMIFMFNKSLGRQLTAIWMEKMTVVQLESQYKVVCAKLQNTFCLVELIQITDLFAAYPDFSSVVGDQYFLRPQAVSSNLNLENIDSD